MPRKHLPEGRSGLRARRNPTGSLRLHLLPLLAVVFLVQGIQSVRVEAAEEASAEAKSLYKAMTPSRFSQLNRAELKGYFEWAQGQWGIRSLSGDQAMTALTTPAATTGLPTEAVLVRGITQYLAERSKDELVILYIDHLKDRLGKPPLSCLLPNAEGALSELPSVGYRQALPRLSTAFAQDLDDLTKRLSRDQCLTNPGNRIGWEWLVVGINVYRGVRSGQHPVQFLQNWSDPSNLPSDPTVLRDCLAVVGILARDFQNAPNDLLARIGEPGERQDYIMKLSAELAVNFEADSLFRAELLKHEDRVFTIVRMLRGLDDDIRAVKSQVLSGSARTAAGLDRILGDLSALVDQAQGWLSQSQQKAGESAIDALGLALGMERAVVARDWVRVVERTLAALRLSGVNVDQRLVTVLDFGSSLASSRTPEDVSALLKSVTEPAGSYRAKRRGDDGRAAGIRVGVNAYVGAAAGAERRLRSGGNGEWVSSYGIAAPIGIELSHGVNPPKAPIISSISVCLTALDFGNPLRIYSGNENGLESAADLRLQDILAVGGFVVLGLGPKTPLSLGLGYQVAPNLRVDQNTDSRVDIRRWTVFLGLDLPLARF